MGPHFDISKLVGAASAPVALIIATSIFLSNLTTKWWSMTGTFTQLTKEYRSLNHNDAPERSESVRAQIGYYDRRLRLLMRATKVLTIAILSFILTVLLTGVTVVFPKTPYLDWAVAACAFAGLAFLAWSVVVELIENDMGVETLRLEEADQPELVEFAERLEHSGAIRTRG